MLTRLHDELLLEVMENLDANSLFAFVQVFQRARDIFIAYCDQVITKAMVSPQNTLSPNFAKYFPFSRTNIEYRLDPTVETTTPDGHPIGRHFKMLLHLVRFACASNAIKIILDSLFPDEKRLWYIQVQNQKSGWDYLSSMPRIKYYVYRILVIMGQRYVYLRNRGLKIDKDDRFNLYYLTLLEEALDANTDIPLPPATIKIPKNVDSVALISLYDNFTDEVPPMIDSEKIWVINNAAELSQALAKNLILYPSAEDDDGDDDDDDDDDNGESTESRGVRSYELVDLVREFIHVVSFDILGKMIFHEIKISTWKQRTKPGLEQRKLQASSNREVGSGYHGSIWLGRGLHGVILNEKEVEETERAFLLAFEMEFE